MPSIACIRIPKIGIACERARKRLPFSSPIALVGLIGKEKKVIVASEEAMRFGIRPGISVTAALSLCPEIQALPYDTAAYEETARVAWNCMAIESSYVQPVSPELCYVQLSGSSVERSLRALVKEIARRLKMAIEAGLGASKLVAYQAVLNATPESALVIVPAGEESCILRTMPIGEVATFNGDMLTKLNRLGIRTLGDVQRTAPRELDRAWGKSGLLLRRLAAGQDSDPVQPLWPPPTISFRVAFEYSPGQGALQGAIQSCVMRIAICLDRERQFCRELGLRIEFEDGSVQERSERLAHPISNTGSLTMAALRLQHRIQPCGKVTVVQVTASGFSATSAIQLVLPEVDDTVLSHERRQHLDAVISQIHRRFGGGSLVHANTLADKSNRSELWTPGLGRRFRSRMAVVADGDGIPESFVWQAKHYRVGSVLDRWRQLDLRSGEPEVRVYRVESVPHGIFELHASAGSWYMGGIAD